MGFYNFFDYKYNIENFSSDLFCPAHLIFIAAVYVLGFVFSYLLRNMKRERICTLLKVLSIIMVLHEVSKVSWESYYDITLGHGFNKEGLLPLYTCSLFIYTLLFAAWGKGRAREYSLSFITTIGLLYGAIGVVYCNGLNYYPFFTFGAFYSLFFHATMFVTGVFLLVTGYKKLEWIDALKALVPILLLAIIAIPADYIMKCDYMLIYSAGGVPLYEDIARRLADKGLRPLFTLLMLATHIPLAAVVIGAYKLIRGIAKKKNDA